MSTEPRTAEDMQSFSRGSTPPPATTKQFARSFDDDWHRRFDPVHEGSQGKDSTTARSPFGESDPSPPSATPRTSTLMSSSYNVLFFGSQDLRTA